MALKIAINGFGRIGRSVTRIIAQRDDIELVAINDLASAEMIAYLLENDSVHGPFNLPVQSLTDNRIQIGTNVVTLSSLSDPHDLDFASLGADMVLECTGLFLTQEFAQIHINKGIKKVLFSAPAKDSITPTFVMGVNHEAYQGQKIISNASCTTNCLGLIAKTLDDAFTIEKGLMTTIHSYTNDQNILDVNHTKDIRRSRAAAVNMIPTSTGAAKAIDLVLPQLKGKLHGQSVRVPTPDVSMVDLNVILKKETTKEEINALFKTNAATKMAGFLLVDEKMRVSQDFVGCQYSAIVAEDLTQVIQGNMVKVMAWYDNEWGYASRLVDMALYISKSH